MAVTYDTEECSYQYWFTLSFLAYFPRHARIPNVVSKSPRTKARPSPNVIPVPADTKGTFDEIIAMQTNKIDGIIIVCKCSDNFKISLINYLSETTFQTNFYLRDAQNGDENNDLQMT